MIRIKPDGEIVEREEKHPQPASTEDMPITLRLPAEAIAVGDQWDATYDVDAQRKSKAKLKVRTRRVCTLKAVEAGIATIEVEYQILSPVSALRRIAVGAKAHQRHGSLRHRRRPHGLAEVRRRSSRDRILRQGEQHAL